jgi:hypothetical protein
MNNMTTPPAAEDAAWASVSTPLSATELNEFCHDIERLFRINPMLEFNSWKTLDKNRYQFSGRNISQEQPFEFDVTLSVQHSDDGLRIDFDEGIKSSTVISIEPAEQGSRLRITDYYERLPTEQREAHLGEVDKSITVWAEYLQRYLINWKRYARFAPWRWYMRRIWQPMKPSARRITYMLLWISLAEVALIALGVAIYFVEFA